MRLHLPQKSKMKYNWMLNKQWPKRSKRLNRFIRFKKQKAEKGPNVKRFLKIQKCKNAIEIKRASENLGVWKQTDLSEIMFTHCTGQLVSKGLFAILNSYKKTNEKNRLIYLYTSGPIVIIIFWKNWRYQKDISKLTDL